MPIRVKDKRNSARSAASRRSVAVTVKASPRLRVGSSSAGRAGKLRKIRPFANPQKKRHAGVSTYAKAMRFLASLSDYEHLRIVRYTPQNFDLDRMRTLLRKLGNPQDKFRSVHVAGTKGKGSTCAMIASMLEANGYKVGLYSSPHLNDVRERIQINGQMISHADFARIARMIQPIVNRSRPVPTYFDVLT